MGLKHLYLLRYPLKDAYLLGFRGIMLRPWKVYFPKDIMAFLPGKLVFRRQRHRFFVSISLWAIYPSYRNNISLFDAFARQRPNVVFSLWSNYRMQNLVFPTNLNEIATDI